MKDFKNSRIITVSTAKVIPLVTERKEKKDIVVSNRNGCSVQLKTHQITKDFLKFLEDSGLEISESDSKEGHRGKIEIDGVAVKVSPINHTNYDGGAYIKVPESDNTDLKNTVKVLKYLRKNGIDIDQFCSHTGSGKSCTLKSGV